MFRIDKRRTHLFVTIIEDSIHGEPISVDTPRLRMMDSDGQHHMDLYDRTTTVQMVLKQHKIQTHINRNNPIRNGVITTCYWRVKSRRDLFDHVTVDCVFLSLRHILFLNGGPPFMNLYF